VSNLSQSQLGKLQEALQKLSRLSQAGVHTLNQKLGMPNPKDKLQRPNHNFPLATNHQPAACTPSLNHNNPPPSTPSKSTKNVMNATPQSMPPKLSSRPSKRNITANKCKSSNWRIT